jgi:hypothetical protein
VRFVKAKFFLSRDFFHDDFLFRGRIQKFVLQNFSAFCKGGNFFCRAIFFHEEFFVRGKMRKFVLQNFNAFCEGGIFFCRANFLKISRFIF